VASLLEPPVPAPPDVVDAQIARALAATVVDLDAARRSRRRPVVIAAAAAIAGVFLVGTLLATRGGSDDELADGPSVQTADATTAAGVAPGAVLEAETASAAATGADGTVNAEQADLRETSQDDAAVPEAAVAEAVRELLTSTDPSPTPGDTGCTEVAETVTDLIGSVERSGAVTIDGVPFVLYIGAERVAVVDQTCAVRVVLRPEA
jgi:hypothetical protein